MIHVFGPILVDAVACSETFSPNSSCIATISTRLGGVGYNLFRAIRHVPCRFVSTIGDGPLSQKAEQDLAQFFTNVDKSKHYLLKRLPGTDVGMYVAFMQQGKLLYGATDSSSYEMAMNETFIAQALEALKPGDIVVTDANMLAKPLAFLISELHSTNHWLVFDPVSIDKSKRAKHSATDVFLATPTEHELCALMGSPVGSSISDHDIHCWMQTQRITHLVVTLGHQGLRWGYHGKFTYLSPTQTLSVKDSTGAGDTLLGALVEGIHDIVHSQPQQHLHDQRSEGVHSKAYDHYLRETVACKMPQLLLNAMIQAEKYLCCREADR